MHKFQCHINKETTYLLTYILDSFCDDDTLKEVVFYSLWIICVINFAW